MTASSPTPLQPIADEQSDSDQVANFLQRHMQRSIGARVSWVVLYEWYSDDWADGPETVKPLSAAEFGAALAFVCERASIRIKRTPRRIWCLDVRLIDPVRAIAG